MFCMTLKSYLIIWAIHRPNLIFCYIFPQRDLNIPLDMEIVLILRLKRCLNCIVIYCVLIFTLIDHELLFYLNIFNLSHLKLNLWKECFFSIWSIFNINGRPLICHLEYYILWQNVIFCETYEPFGLWSEYQLTNKKFTKIVFFSKKKQSAARHFMSSWQCLSIMIPLLFSTQLLHKTIYYFYFIIK